MAAPLLNSINFSFTNPTVALNINWKPMGVDIDLGGFGDSDEEEDEDEEDGDTKWDKVK